MELYCRGTAERVLEGKDSLLIYFCGCDFRCPYCYNREILEFSSEFLVKVSEIKSSIRRSGSGSVHFAGAEPCLQRDPLSILSGYAKSQGKMTILHTNGSRPEVLSQLLRKELFDKVIIDIKAPFDETFQKATRSATYFKGSSEIMGSVRSSIRLLSDSDVDVEARTTIVPSLLYRKEDVIRIAGIINDAGFSWRLQAFIPGNSVNKTFSSLRPLSGEFMESLKDACRKEYPELNLV